MKKILILLVFQLITLFSFAQNGFSFDTNKDISLRQGKLYTAYKDVDLLTLEQANLVFAYAKDSTKINFNYVYESKIKTHALSLLLTYKKIKHYKIWNFNPKKISFLLESQKIQIPNKLQKDTINLDYHVSILLYVQDKETIKPMVVDPSLCDSLVSVKKWLEIQSAPKSYYSILDSKWYNFETLNSLASLDKKKYTFPKGISQNLTGGFMLYINKDEIEEALAVQHLGVEIIQNIVNKTTSSHKKIVFSNLVQNHTKLVSAIRDKKVDPVLKPYIPLLKPYQDKYASLKNRWEQKFVMLKYGETPIDPNLPPPPIIENKK